MHSSSKFLYFSISQLSAISFALFALLCLSASPVSAQMKIGSNPTTITAATNLEIEGTGSVKTVFLQNGKVGIGTTGPAGLLSIQSDAASLASAGDQFHITRYDGNGGYLVGRSAGGTSGAPSATGATDALLTLQGAGYVNGAFTARQVDIGLRSNQAWTTGARGTYISFRTTPDNSTTIAEAMRITGSGNVGIGTTSPTQRLNVANTSGQWDVPLWVGPSSHATSRRTGITMDDWSWMQDANGNGTKDFFLWQGSAATSRINFSTTGNVGIGTSASSLIRLNTYYSNTNLAGPLYGSYAHADAIATSNGAYHTRGTMAIARPTISTGVTNSGWAIAAGFQALRANGTDLGTLSNLYGMDVTYGHNSNVGATAVTTNAYGMVITPYAQVGTIANMYDLFLAGTQTGGTLTNHYALYQADANSKNYFAGKVGIGTTSPVGKLDVAGSSGTLSVSTTGAQILYGFDGYNYLTASGNNATLQVQASGTSGKLVFATNSAERMRIDSSGNVGIGTTGPAAKLDVTTSGTQIAFRSITSSATGYASLMHNTASNYYCYVGYLNTYSIVCSGPTSLPSDMRLKKDITPLTDISGLTAIMNLRPISYTWKDTKKGSRTEYGFVAQEVEKVFPNLVGSLAPTTDEEKAQTGGAPMKTLQYEGFIAPLVKSVQELKAENDALKVRVSRLESLLTNK